jgi:PKD repeat protein
LALAAAALVVPSNAQAKQAAAADPYKVLVVTSATDALTTAGVDAITAAGTGIYTVTSPTPANVGAQFTPEGLDQYRAVVFLNTGMASPLTDAQRAVFESYYKKGGGFVGIGSAIETDEAWSFMTDLLGTRSSGRTALQSGTVKVFDRVHDASKNLPEYWERTDHWYNFATNVRGQSHVLASVVEDPFGPQPGGHTLDGIAGGTMGANHPISFCKDYQGGRSFYTGLGNTPESFNASMVTHLKGAIDWAAGQSSPVYSDCGATVLRNYQQVKVSGPPNLNEPIGFDQFPDGRIVQTSRRGDVRLHNPATGVTTQIANFADPALPLTQRIYTHSEDGLYGPAVDNNFAQNKWVYLFYSPQTVVDVKLSDGSIVTQTTPTTTPPNTSADPKAWDPYLGYFQLSRFKFVEDANGPRLDLTTEQQILKVPVNRQECCHVAGDIDFDKHNNLWLVTGDDTPAGGINAGGYGPFNDQLTDEQQVIRVTNATGGTYTLTFNGQTTAPIPYNATNVQVDAALEALSSLGPNQIQFSGGPANTANMNVFFRRAKQQSNQPQITIDGSGLTGNTPTVSATTALEGGLYQRPTGDDRRSTLNTNDLRGKIIRIKVKDTDIAAADANKADYGSGGAYTIPAGNLYPLVNGQPQPKTRAEVHSMGFRNPFRIQVDENDVAYISDYSPDASNPARSRGPSGVGRFEIVRKPSNYGYPICYSSKLGYYKWNFHEFLTAPDGSQTTTVGAPLGNPPEPIDCGASTIINDSRFNLEGGPGNDAGLREIPPITDPEIWYSYNDNRAVNPLGTPCFGHYATTPGPIAPGSSTECPRLFPELYTGGVGAHGAAKYNFDPANPNPKKFPAYYDESVFLGEFTQDTLRELKLDSQNRVFKINNALDCGAFGGTVFPFECDSPMDMQFGADGSFYLLTYGDGFFNINADAGMYRWDYVKGQRAPIALLQANRTNGPAPLTVQFTGSNSNDPDPGDSIRFEWNFGDGSPLSEEANPTHTYTSPGNYTAVLKVTDSSGQSTSTSTVITVGNTAPTVTLTAPIDGGLFSFGDTIQYKVTVTDPEDGPVNCNDVKVSFVLGHDDHGHAEQENTGCIGFLQTDPQDVSHGGNVFGVVSASYTDKGGSGGAAQPLQTTTQVQLRQKHQEVENVAAQSGTNTATTTDPNGGGSHRGSLSAGDWLRLNGPFNLHQIDSITFRVADAGGGRTAGSPLAAIEVRQDSITGPLLTTANLVSTGGTAAWSSQTFSLGSPEALAGKHELFFVFRAVTGGATGNNLFNLNWAEFVGNGVTVQSVSTPGTVGGTVPATLSLTLGSAATFAPFIPGVGQSYTASTVANVISSAGDAALSVADPSSNATGRLVNGSFSLAQPVQANAGGAFAAVGGSASPTLLKSWTAPTSNEAVTVNFRQTIGANEPLRTGSYSKTLTFTLSTTNP